MGALMTHMAILSIVMATPLFNYVMRSDRAADAAALPTGA